MSQQFDVCIRGDGVVGRTLALLLARERLRVALVSPPPEVQSAPASPDVRAYALNAASKTLLEGLRSWPDTLLDQTPAVTPVLQIEVQDSSLADSLLDFSASQLGQPALTWIVDVPTLEQQLAQAVRFSPQIEQLTAPVKAALQVVCEGKHSSSREEFGASYSIKPYGQKAIAAHLESSLPHQGVARQWFDGGDVLALLPLAGPDANAAALVWSVSNDHADALQAMTDEDFCAALQKVCGPAVGQLSLTSKRACWPLALASADRWVGPGWALAGDAAHTIHPLAGQGLNLGLADAQALAKTLAEREYWRALGDEKLLRRYERSRRADVAAMGMVTDGLYSAFSHSAGPLQALRQWGMRGFARSGPLKSWVMRRATGL